MAKSSTWSFDGQAVHVTDLEKVYWPEDGRTKGDVLDYYKKLAPVILPHLKDRPITIREFPAGIEGKSAYRRDIYGKKPEWLKTTTYQPASGTKPSRLLLVDDTASLIWLANRDAIEFHMWVSKLPDLNEPDRAVFDLDPGDLAGFDDVLHAALHLRDYLASINLIGFPKTSGGKGLHVLVPLAPGHTFERVRDWVREIAETLAEAHHGLIAVAHGGTHRGTHVTIDHAQNAIARNLAAPYTIRGAPGATVSTPVSWEEIERGAIKSKSLTLKEIPGRLQTVGDLFAPIFEQSFRLPIR